MDTKIIYRKHLGLIGFAFAVAHTLLSYTALQRLFVLATWQKGLMWPALSATVALLIFAVMALISNKYAAHELGGVWWRRILRLGHPALGLVWVHVVLLKGPRWVRWWQEGMPTFPAMSLVVSIFIGLILVMRVALWWSLRRKKNQVVASSC